MIYNFRTSTADEALVQLTARILAEGDEIGSRAGRVKELMHVGITLDTPWRREILNPSRQVSIAAQIAETAWVLSGRDDVEWLSHYLPRAAEFSDDGTTWRGAYGPRLRSWPRANSDDVVDQLAQTVDLLKVSPGSRRAVNVIFDPTRDLEEGKDIPCNNWLSWSSRLGKLDLHVGIRSNDLIWGWSGINTFEWSVLQEVVAGILGMAVGGLHFSTTSLHIYDRHWERAGHIAKNPVLPRPEDSPRFAGVKSLDDFDWLLKEWFLLEGRIRNGHRMVDEVNDFPEPMLQSWLRVLQWWWHGDRIFLAPLTGTALQYATVVSIQPKHEVDERPSAAPEAMAMPFIDKVIELHNEKHAAYGDSWCRRGEMIGILANVARKVDRLEGGETSDETKADTAIDLFVYLCKYAAWIRTDGQNDPDLANKILREIASGQYPEWELLSEAYLIQSLADNFNILEEAARKQNVKRKVFYLNSMLWDSYILASRWAAAL